MLAAGLAPKLAWSANISAKKPRAGTRSLPPHVGSAFAALDQDKLVRLAMDLCNIPSPLGDSDKLARFFSDRMQEEGLISRLQPFASDRSNVLGILKGSGGGRTLMFNGTMENDLSPDATSVPTARIVDGEWISGVGIWDMKASLAAALAAASAVRKAGIGLSGDVLIAGVVGMMDEASVETRLKGKMIEGYGTGTKHLLARGITADFGVVGTPTSFKLVQQHFGITAVRIDVLVKNASLDTIDDFTSPTLFSQPASNAVREAAEIVQALDEWMPDYQRRNTVVDQAPQVKISAIEGGLPSFASDPEKSSIFIFVATPPGARATPVLDEIRAILAMVCGRRPNVEARAETYLTDPLHFVPDDNPIVTTLRAAHADVFGRKPDSAIVQWHSDAGLLTQQGIPSVDYGPAGKLTTSPEGAVQEFVRISDLISCTRVYIDLIVRVCGDRAV